MSATGPLAGIRVVELAGLGPGSYAGVLLADLGADVLVVDRPRPSGLGSFFLRGKDAVSIDLKTPAGVEAFLALTDTADVVIDVFRPGVAERLGIGPDQCSLRNPGLVYGRLTGYGQDGPYAQRAGHDLNYLAMSGALDALGRADAPPTPPVNLLADFAGGGMLLAFGIVSALLERATSQVGQVVDTAMTDGAALLFGPLFTGRANGKWGPRGTNAIDTGAHFYEVYETADGGWMSVAAMEPQFYARLRETLGLPPESPAEQWDAAHWDVKKKELAAVFRTRTRNEWVAAFADVDACVEPVLTPEEAPDHPLHRARTAFVEFDGLPQPAPSPRFSRTDPRRPTPGATRSAADALCAWGLSREEAARLVEGGGVADFVAVAPAARSVLSDPA